MTTSLAPICSYCNGTSVLATGEDIYPHREDLHDLNFWKCPTCEDVYVGCHKAGAFVVKANGDKIISDGTLPMGRLANAALRRAKSDTHVMFDAIWKRREYDKQTRFAKRRETYAWLAHKMNIAIDDCHIAMFTLEQCYEAMEHIRLYTQNAVDRRKGEIPTVASINAMLQLEARYTPHHRRK